MEKANGLKWVQSQIEMKKDELIVVFDIVYFLFDNVISTSSDDLTGIEVVDKDSDLDKGLIFE